MGRRLPRGELATALLPVPIPFYSVLWDGGLLRVGEDRGGSWRVWWARALHQVIKVRAMTTGAGIVGENDAIRMMGKIIEYSKDGCAL